MPSFTAVVGAAYSVGVRDALLAERRADSAP
jgi:hypothetical protein